MITVPEPNLPAVADTWAISDETRTMLADAIPQNTARSYRTQWTAFTAWCATTGWQPLPAGDDVVTEYAAHLIRAGKAPGSIAVALSVIRTRHDLAGLPKPETTAARKLLHAYRRQRADAGIHDRQAHPAVAGEIRRMLDVIGDPALADEKKLPQVLRDRVILLLGFGMFARRSELSGLNLSDVTETGNGLVVRLARSKTDQTARGTERVLLYAPRPDACPVRAVRDWRAFLAGRGIDSGPLLYRINRHGQLLGRLSGQGVAVVLDRLGRAAGIGHLSGHSLRAGAATSAAEAGATSGQIEEGGGWAKGSAAVGRYIHRRDRWMYHPHANVNI
ncbi:MAG: tyrosine-type recombinase/integrase [Steroidobacteraceae bacterium]|nr:tyrosine-type recombinase/integrase [Steroidobacteraceae bacterium]